MVCTHLHVDHVGWNTSLVDGEWRPTFPESRYLFAGPEYRHWAQEPFRQRPEHVDSIQPVVDAGLVDLVDVDAEVAPGVSLCLDARAHARALQRAARVRRRARP